MSKNKKTPATDATAAIYALLTAPTKKGASRKVVLTTDRKVHVMDGATPVPTGIDIDAEFKNFDDFLARGEQTVLAYHEELLKVPAPKKQDAMTTALYVWAWFIKEGTPHLANTTVEGEKVRKSSIGQRLYRRGTAPAETLIPTPQARACYAIFLDMVKTADTVTEEDLKRSVIARASELKTKQDPWRIFQYYRPNLIALGLLRHD